MDECLGDFLKIGEIEVHCNISTGELKSLSIKERMGIHTVVEVVVGIKPGSVNIAELESAGQPIKIIACKDGKKILLFWGVIGQIIKDQKFDYEDLLIRAYSLSWLMDLEKKNRSFQGETSITELIQKISEEQSFSLLCSAQDKMTEAPFIQYRETDWDFIKRLSTHLGIPIYAANDYLGQGICVGLQEQDTQEGVEVIYEKWCMDEERARITDFDIKKAMYYEILTGQIFHVGKGVWYRGRIFWPFAVDIVLRDGMLHCISKLAEKDYHTTDKSYNPYLKGLSLTGKVLKREKEMIKIHLDIDEEQDMESAHLYPWMPEHGNLVYCMPEEENDIRLFVAGVDERDATGIDCVRRNGSVCEETQTPQNRWFSTTHDKKMTLQTSMMELTGKADNSKISLMDSTGESIVSDGNILIQAAGTVVLQGTKVNMNASGEITAIKRELGDPAVVNFCYNLDATGKQTKFHNLEKLPMKSVPKGGSGDSGSQSVSPEQAAAEKEKREKLRFEMQELMEREKEKSNYHLENHIVNIVSAIPQVVEQDEISRIAIGFRPILGVMRRDRNVGYRYNENNVSSVSQVVKRNEISQATIGFRPALGTMKGERNVRYSHEWSDREKPDH